MKRFNVLLVVLTFISWGAYSQDNASQRPVRTVEEMALKQTERLQRDLDLSEEQCDTLYRIHLKYIKMRRVGETREVIEKRMAEMRKEILNILTEAQQERMQQSLDVAEPPKACGLPRMGVGRTGL